MANEKSPEKLNQEPSSGNLENLDLPKKEAESNLSPEKRESFDRDKIEQEGNKEELNKAEERVKKEAETSRGAGQKVLNYHQRRAIEIDNILSDGLHDTFLQLDPKKQKEFKEKGEETVSKINTLLDKAKIKADKIVSLIKKWLKVIPGINQFFLEQEAKIKADKIINLKNKL